MTNTLAKQSQTSTRRDIHQEVTDIIVKQLEQGTVPWYQPWQGGNAKALDLPYNGASKNHYRGINIVLLWGTAIEKQYTSAEWATFKQWSAKKETIRKGEKGTMIVYYDVFEKENEDQEQLLIPFMKSSYVFNRCQLNSYAEIDVPLMPQKSLVERITPVDQFVSNTKVIIEHGHSGAAYKRIEDKVIMPAMEVFIDTPTCSATEGYYSTLLHELVHWSGAPHRLDRTKGKKFGDHHYATEELVAELGAAFLCAEFDIATASKGDHAAYIAGWLKVLKDNKHFIVAAASEASKAVYYMKGLTP